MSTQDSTICYRMGPSRVLLTTEACPLAYSEAESGGVLDIPPCLLSQQQHSVVGLEKIKRIALMVTPQSGGEFMDQAWEALSTIRAVVRQQVEPMSVTVQTVFLQRMEYAPAVRRLFHAFYRTKMPPTNFVLQPPCGGEALAVEAWAVGGKGGVVRHFNPNLATVEYDGLRWLHCAGMSPLDHRHTAYAQSADVFAGMDSVLRDAGASFKDVVRTWIYQGSITEPENGIERYRELNRARTDFFEDLGIGKPKEDDREGLEIYPASTGIGTGGAGLVTSCLALQTRRPDVRLTPLENPLQTPSFRYGRRYSEKSPKFSRAMAVTIGDYATTLISGTASIVNSETMYPGDAAGQTEQTIDNIAALIGPENFERHGLAGGAQLGDLAKVRVYVKRGEDYDTCREVCERRFGALPTIYARADVCRPDLLVEIEGVAFSKNQ